MLKENMVPIVCFAGYSDSGKTTLIEALIPLLNRAGHRVAVIKHDGHDALRLDNAGTDSGRFFGAGAYCSVAVSASRAEALYNRGLTLEEAAKLVEGADIILAEGFKSSGYSKIGLCRAETGFTAPISSFCAVVSDAALETDVPHFRLYDAEGVARFIEENWDSFSRIAVEG